MRGGSFPSAFEMGAWAGSSGKLPATRKRKQCWRIVNNKNKETSAVHSPRHYAALLRSAHEPVASLRVPFRQEPVTLDNALKSSIVATWLSGTRGSYFPESSTVHHGHTSALRPNRRSLRDPFEAEMTRRCIYDIIVRTEIERSAAHLLISKQAHRLIRAWHGIQCILGQEVLNTH
jgi:hypothetical protein